jgi:hypothetical protein
MDVGSAVVDPCCLAEGDDAFDGARCHCHDMLVVGVEHRESAGADVRYQHTRLGGHCLARAKDGIVLKVDQRDDGNIGSQQLRHQLDAAHLAEPEFGDHIAILQRPPQRVRQRHQRVGVNPFRYTVMPLQYVAEQGGGCRLGGGTGDAYEGGRACFAASFGRLQLGCIAIVVSRLFDGLGPAGDLPACVEKCVRHRSILDLRGLLRSVPQKATVNSAVFRAVATNFMQI